MPDPNGSVYLDFNATAPLRPEAAAAISAAVAVPANPSSVHRFGRRARKLVEDAREQVAHLIGGQPGGLVFTSGGTEANALALRGKQWRRMLVSGTEHVSVLAAAEQAGAAESLPVERDGLINAADFAAILGPTATETLVSVMLANNETGVIQPISELAAIARAARAVFHCDAVQAAGKIPIDVVELGVDLLTLSAHKLGGPQGVGALWVRPELRLQPLFAGGGQERGMRAGTENVPGIAGFGAAAEAAHRTLPQFARLAELRDGIEREILLRSRQAHVHGATAPRLPNTSCLGLAGVRAETQVIALDLAGIAVSSGSACSSGKVRTSHVLAAMGVDQNGAAEAIRVSMGWSTTPSDAERFVKAWSRLAGHRQAA
jgi:cysteine desulfurase